MISISTSNLSYRIGVRDILTDVTFSLEDGDRLAIVGVNGSGKSTLMRLITGEYTPDDGAIYIAKDKTVGMLHQDDAFNILREEDGSPVSDTVLLTAISQDLPLSKKSSLALKIESLKKSSLSPISSV